MHAASTRESLTKTRNISFVLAQYLRCDHIEISDRPFEETIIPLVS